ncbi:MAG: hypothetical protein M1836_000126 [Candelina mexicana]|nr:MAG: hypothetical protein M1836_000126 [Candelina mexicana]
MSDAGRKSFGTKAKEEITPDSSKSTQQKIKEGVTDTVDRGVRYVLYFNSPGPMANVLCSGGQPDSEKSTSQKVFDKGQRSSDEHVHGGTENSIGDKVKGAFGMNK